MGIEKPQVLVIDGVRVWSTSSIGIQSKAWLAAWLLFFKFVLVLSEKEKRNIFYHGVPTMTMFLAMNIKEILVMWENDIMYQCFHE